MRTLYFDCFAGASGNMILGCLLGLGIDRSNFEAEIPKLGLPGVQFNVSTVDRSGISAIHVEVVTPESHEHRHLSNIRRIIDESDLNSSIKQRSTAIFTRLAEAEAKVHGISVERVHFHEVGAVDAIVDIVGACIGFEMLGVERFACSPINVGTGFVEMEHGKFPVPPPAVAELLADAQIYSNEISGELTTPTGAAIISTLSGGYGTLPNLKVERTAYGAGSRSYEKFPNVLRLILGETHAAATTADNLCLIETNVDDITPQVLGFVMERAFEIGALDCWFTPIQMKKNRPGTRVSVLCEADRRSQLSALLYRETTTLGLRVRQIERECLLRENVRVRTRFGEVDVKVAYLNGEVTNAMPEFEQVRRLALENNVPLITVQNESLAELKRNSQAFSA